MLRGLERIGTISSGGPKAGPECGNCGACPLAGGCPRGSTAIKSNKDLSSKPANLVTGTADIFIGQGLKRGVFVFGPINRGRSIFSEASEKVCFQCGKDSNTCPHSKRKAA